MSAYLQENSIFSTNEKQYQSQNTPTTREANVSLQTQLLSTHSNF